MFCGALLVYAQYFCFGSQNCWSLRRRSKRAANMADTAISIPHSGSRSGRRSGVQRFMQRKSTIAFFLTLPLILLIVVLVAYPAVYAVHLATRSKRMDR
jgi:hypothetical protein